MRRIIDDDELQWYAKCRETQRRLFPGDKRLLTQVREPLTVTIGDLLKAKAG